MNSGSNRAARHRETLPGNREKPKARLTETIVREVTCIPNYGDESLSFALEEIAPDDWTEHVFRADTLGKGDKLMFGVMMFGVRVKIFRGNGYDIRKWPQHGDWMQEGVGEKRASK